MDSMHPSKGFSVTTCWRDRRLRAAQSRAVLAVNAGLVRLYWEIGRTILEHQTSEGWGTKVVDRLASDLKAAFPGMKGFSSRNLKYMRTFAERCPDFQIGQQPAAQLPWFHLVTLLTRGDRGPERAWLASQTRSSRGGPETSSSPSSRRGCSIVRARLSPTLRLAFPSHRRSWRRGPSRIPTSSTSLASAMKPWSGTSDRPWSATSRTFCSNPAPASPSWGGSTAWGCLGTLIAPTGRK